MRNESETVLGQELACAMRSGFYWDDDPEYFPPVSAQLLRQIDNSLARGDLVIYDDGPARRRKRIYEDVLYR